MGMIGPATSIGNRPHEAIFERPGDPIPDGDGGYIDGPPTPIATLFVRISPATAGDQERLAPGTILSHGSYIVAAPYHPGLTTRTRMHFAGRTFNVNGVTNLDERGIELRLVCDEVV